MHLAPEDTGLPVEIKASNLRCWGTKVMIQIISSGSTVPCEGSLVKISSRSLAKVANDAIEDRAYMKPLESNILLKGLAELQWQMKGIDLGVVQNHCIHWIDDDETRAASSLLKSLLTNNSIKKYTA
jgi:hypothetical protein